MSSDEDKYMHKSFCPQCSQKLAFSTRDLKKKIACPRCGTVYTTGDLIDRQQTVQAVIVERRAPVTDGGAAPAPRAPGRDGVRGTAPSAPLRSSRPPPPPPGRSPGRASKPPPPPPQALASAEHRLFTHGSAPAVSPPAPVTVDAAGSGEAAAMPAREQARETQPAGAGFLDKMLDLGRRIDDVLYGKHAMILFGAAILIVIAQILHIFLGWGWTEYAALALFVIAPLFLMFVLVASYRDEEGMWKMDMAVRRAKSALVGLWDSTINFPSTPLDEKFLTVYRLAFIGGALMLALRAALAIVLAVLVHARVLAASPGFLHVTAYVAWGGFVVSGGFYLSRLLQLQTFTKKLTQWGSKDVVLVKKTMSDMPLVLDFINSPDKASKSAGTIKNPLLKDLADILENWRPRGSYEHEDELQGALHRYLRKYLPKSNACREYPIKVPGTGARRRIDLVVFDFIAMEMKRDLRSEESLQRAGGRLREYAAAWGDKGPLILLMCASEPDFLERSVGALIQELRSQGIPALAVAAGPRPG